jgi:hypothetical protein
LAKVKLQNDFIGAAGHVKRWIGRAAWKLAQAGRLARLKRPARRRTELETERIALALRPVNLPRSLVGKILLLTSANRNAAFQYLPWV